MQDKKKTQKAKELLTKAAFGNDKTAQLNLGFLLRTGKLDDKQKAFDLFINLYTSGESTNDEKEYCLNGIINLAMKGNFFLAQCELVKQVCTGISCQEELKKDLFSKITKKLSQKEWELFLFSGAYDHLTAAADNGNAEISFFLGRILYESRNTIKNSGKKRREQAIEYLSKAQRNGNLSAGWYLLFIYLNEKKINEACSVLLELLNNWHVASGETEDDVELKIYVDGCIDLLKKMETPQILKKNSELAYLFSKLYQVGLLKDESDSKNQKKYLKLACDGNNINAISDYAILLMVQANESSSNTVNIKNEAAQCFYDVLLLTDKASEQHQVAMKNLEKLCDQPHVLSFFYRVAYYFKHNHLLLAFNLLVEVEQFIKKEKDLQVLLFFLNSDCRKQLEVAADDNGAEITLKAVAFGLANLFRFSYDMQEELEGVKNYDHILLSREYYDKCLLLGWKDINEETFAQVQLKCGEYENSCGQYDKALKSFLRSYSLDPQGLAKYQILGLFLDKDKISKFENDEQLDQINIVLKDYSNDFVSASNFSYEVFLLFESCAKELSPEKVNSVLRYWLELSVEQNIKFAFYILGNAYKDGKFGYQKNDKKAEEYLLKAIKSDNKIALFDLQEIYVRQKQPLAVNNVFTELAENENLMACLFLGILNFNNLIKDASFNQACFWVEKGLLLEEANEESVGLSYIVKSKMINNLNTAARKKKNKAAVTEDVIFARYLLGLDMFINGKKETDRSNKINSYALATVYFNSVIKNKDLVSTQRYLKAQASLIDINLDKAVFLQNTSLYLSVVGSIIELFNEFLENDRNLFARFVFRVLNTIELEIGKMEHSAETQVLIEAIKVARKSIFTSGT